MSAELRSLLNSVDDALDEAEEYGFDVPVEMTNKAIEDLQEISNYVDGVVTELEDTDNDDDDD